jgi:hypothetical protein
MSVFSPAGLQGRAPGKEERLSGIFRGGNARGNRQGRGTIFLSSARNCAPDRERKSGSRRRIPGRMIII